MKRGGGGTDKRGIERGWVDVGLAPDCEFLSVKIDEPLVETPSPGQSISSLSSLTSGLATSSCFSSLITTSSFTFKGGKVDSSCSSALVDLSSVFWMLRSLDSGRPRLTVNSFDGGGVPKVYNGKFPSLLIARILQD